jgi:GAF domain-containing protein
VLPAPIPHDDDDRLQALHALLILDTPPEQRFDRIVRFAADEFEVPVALISLVDRDRQWFKARVGTEVCETARDISFCGHALTSNDVLLVPDAVLDPRFADNPLVIGAPFIRFYAGAPLETRPGLRVGTLCLIDTRPRALDATDLAILHSLRQLAVGELLGRDAEGLLP